MKRSSRITSIRSTARFQQQLLEKFVNSNPPELSVKVPENPTRAKFSSRFQPIHCCFARIPVKGTVEIDYLEGFFCNQKSIKVPVSSVFMVTCTRKISGKFKSTWSCSLS